MNTDRMVGPYRLRRVLGRGGTSIVWDAWDERLERPVAVKQILPDEQVSEQDVARRRERLWREARAVARLSHPAVVQVHDLLETDDGDWIVMEQVPGTTLAELLRDGPLPLGRALALASEVAAGLAEAHRRGLLHRDVKTENVRVTPAGHAKVLDFGLAKAYWGARDGKLTDAGEVVGTCRAMSPEQVQGLELDPRTDLFSFGVLLYEVVTGVSPFFDPSPARTLDRVCRHQPPPAAELNPAVPDELSALIDELLAKERNRRPRDAGEVAERLAALAAQISRGGTTLSPHADPRLDQPTVAGGDAVTTSAPAAHRRWIRAGLAAAVLCLLGLLVAALLRRVDEPAAAPAAPLAVAVAPTEVGVGGERDDVPLVAAGVQAAVVRALTGLTGVAAFTPEPTAPPASAPPQLARTLGADEVVTSRLVCPGEGCQLTLERRAGADGRVLWIEAFEVPPTDLPLLTTAVAAALARGFPERARRTGVPALSVDREDYVRYLELERAFRSREEGLDRDRMIAALTEIRGRSPSFVEAYLLEARLRSFRAYDTRRREDPSYAFALLREARTLAPEDPRVPDTRFGVAIPAGRLDEAEEALTELERLAPGDPQVQVRRALLAERRGQGEEALALMRVAAQRRPSWRTLLELANLEVRQGAVDAARITLEELRERFPEDLEGASLLAQIELLSGSPERAAELYAELVARSPQPVELGNLGTAQLLLGRYDEAAVTFQRVLKLVPDNPAVVLNAADAELLRGREEAASALYRRVVALIAADPASETFWQWQSVRAQALAHLGDRRGAASAIQKALQLAPQNPQAAYEAALVYALVGDEASALASAEQALAGGVDERWFRFPWFDDLRRAPAFGALLTAAAG